MLMLCPICAGEFQAVSESCPGCGVGLVPGTMDQQTATAIDAAARQHIEFVELCRPQLYPVAMLIKQMLEQNGVRTMLQGGHSISVLPYLAFGGGMRLLVDATQHEFAENLYRAYFETDEELDYTADE